MFSHPSYRYAELQNGNIQSAYIEHHLSAPNFKKNLSEVNGDILAVTMRIEEKFPELSKYIEEMPVKYFDNANDEINVQNLQEYYQSLEALLKNYSTYHGPAK